MTSNMKWLRATLVAGVAIGLGASSALASPVVEPFTCEILTGGTATCSPSSAVAPSAGVYELYVQNGDDDTPRITSGSVTINGSVVLSDTAFESGRELMLRPVVLLAGVNTVSVTINGDTGQYVSLTILPRTERLLSVTGRLLVAWADAANLQIDLKNGSHVGSRHYRVVFYNPDGTYAADSGSLVLAPKASLSQAVSTFLVNGNTSWANGSIEIFFAGGGRGRLWGQVVATEGGVSSIVKMDQAGSRLFDPLNPARRGE
jgi:hypothetical protein